jgi:hypothetical protein
VLTAIQNCADIFEDLHPIFKRDKEIALYALDGYDGENNFQYIDKSLQEERGFLLSAIKKSPNIFKSLSPIFRKDREISLHALDGYAGENNFQYIDKSLQQDRDFILNAIKKSPNIFKDLDPILKKDKEIALYALDGYAGNNNLQYIDKSLQQDKEFMKSALLNKVLP